ncbi:MAG: DUF881 domain-containing protein [Nocardioidaceae bacterium]|nr:DUF881 domain-containing protein [Nocardioidaceae bacterium]
MSDKPDLSTGEPRSDSSGDAYVGLLTQIMTQTLDQDYLDVAQRRESSSGDSPPRWQVGAVAVLLLFGLMLGLAALNTAQEKPVVAAERAELIEQIESNQGKLDNQQATLASLSDEVTKLQQLLAANVADDRLLTNQLTSLGIDAGTLAVTGPGVEVTVDDSGYSVGESGGVILDSDLQLLVNALWQAGAEAIAVDEHRMTTLTAIRFAGEAITVDYRSLTPPYIIEATGDPDTMPARLLETRAGQAWLDLEANFDIQFEVVAKDKVSIPGDARDNLLYAEAKGAS